VVKSSPLIPEGDPTLLFTSAGMVQFKPYYLGLKTDMKRAASCQKSFRTTDIDNVGKTIRHLTFFEMLGNFSFGDYFKKESIAWGWEFLTKEMGLDPKRLYPSIYKGGVAPRDAEARGIWENILPAELHSHIIELGDKDNFWAMGDTGPCGPCSEIFFDHGDKIPGGPPGSPDADGDRYIEIWNLVFMQYETLVGGERTHLPRPSIDTGMGLERVAAVLQGKHDNYDIDLMRALIRASAEATGVDADGPQKVSHRVVADHLRASAFLVADGVLPSNEGRGYVLRRIMRRAMRHAHLIGSKDPLMYRLVPTLVAEMGTAYPELKRAEALVAETLKLEETRFRETLARGLKLLDETTGSLKSGDRLAGETAFKLYDTYGFPLDLTQDALKARGIGVDTDGFGAAMAKQKADARKAWAGSGEAATDAQWFAVLDDIGKTEFLGYDTEEAEGTVVAILKDGVRIAKAKAGEIVLVLTNQTPFYGESGGQVGDAGALKSARASGKVIDTEKKLGALHVHVVE